MTLTAQEGGRTIIGFGYWSNKDVAGLIKKRPPGPVKRFEHGLKKYCRVQSIDEYRTSKLQAECHREMKNQYCRRVYRDGVDGTLIVHNVLHCTNNGGHNMTVKGDANASKSMLMFLMREFRGQPRPLAFSPKGE